MKTIKRIVVGTHSECISVIKSSKEMGDRGYDFYDMHPTTKEEYTKYIKCIDNNCSNLYPPDGVAFNPDTVKKFWAKNELYTLFSYKIVKNYARFDRAKVSF